MPFQETQIEGVKLFVPMVFEDDRGLFYESFRHDEALAAGFDFNVAQVNNSVSNRGVLRGIHFKQNPPGQQKFVSVPRGAIYDVVIDLRKSSPTFGNWQGFELNDLNRRSLLIGNGIGHAFLSLEDDTAVSYLCDTVFEPALEHGINPLSAGIDWHKVAEEHEVPAFRISHKDESALGLIESTAVFFK
jgi:dTDP-4-dehydrorhamnose 3,5-epimerase